MHRGEGGPRQGGAQVRTAQVTAKQVVAYVVRVLFGKVRSNSRVCTLFLFAGTGAVRMWVVGADLV